MICDLIWVYDATMNGDCSAKLQDIELEAVQEKAHCAGGRSL